MTRFLLRSLAVIFLILPLAFWGLLNSGIPYLMTRRLAQRVSRGDDQYDTAKILIGLFTFGLFWVAQSLFVSHHVSQAWLAVYLLSLPLTAPVALFFLRERERIVENLRVFFLFLRKRKLKPYLRVRRERLERELAQMVRLSKRHHHG